MNELRKNVAVLSRNVADTVLEDPFSDFSFLIEKNGDYIFDLSNPIWPTNKRTIVVVGHDVILDTANDIGSTSPSTTKALIVLKDFQWNGGNVVVTDKVKRVYAAIYAEGSIFSWEKDAISGNIVPYVLSGALNIPQNQLYIKGLLISKNTIGWAQQIPTICPVVVNECDLTNSQIYDLNYFRTYDVTDSSQKSTPVGMIDPRLDDAPMIIDYEQSIVSDPPPGVSHFLE